MKAEHELLVRQQGVIDPVALVVNVSNGHKKCREPLGASSIRVSFGVENIEERTDLDNAIIIRIRSHLVRRLRVISNIIVCLRHNTVARTVLISALGGPRANICKCV